MAKGKANTPTLIAMSAPVEIVAATDSEGKATTPTFSVTAYTGGAMQLAGWDHPVVVDMAGMTFGKSLVANLDHDSTKRVGIVTSHSTDGGQLVLSGKANAATAARDEVVNSARDEFVWQASIEAMVGKREFFAAGKTVTANGQSFTGPIYVARQTTLKGFGFVNHGADDNTTVSIAATADKEKSMHADNLTKDEKTWYESMMATAVDWESLTEHQVDTIKANFTGRPTPAKKISGDYSDPNSLDAILAREKTNRERVSKITELAATAIQENPDSIDTIEAMARMAIEGGWDVQRFELEILRASRPQSFRGTNTGGERGGRLNDKIVEAAICMAGGLRELDASFDEQTLDMAHRRFKHGIGLKELFVLAAECNGHRSPGYNVTIDVQRAAFNMTGPRSIKAFGFSTLSLPNVFSNVANKFIRDGWMSVDQSPMQIAEISSVNDFKQITTISLTGGLMFEQLGPDGEIKHGTLGELTYTNQADTYARMFAITRQNIINDDLGVLTRVPRRLGRGGMLKLNDIFWTKFLNNSAFFTSGNANVSTGAGSALSLAGLAAAEVVFMKQTDPDGLPLGTMPAVLVVPPSLKATALELMTSALVVTGENTTRPDRNIWSGRYTVVSSPYMENAAYTGNSAAAWYLLADPMDLPVIQIVAVGGRIQPTVETADADFNVLGVQMRGYSDIGVNLQEFRGGVRSAGS